MDLLLRNYDLTANKAYSPNAVYGCVGKKGITNTMFRSELNNKLHTIKNPTFRLFLSALNNDMSLRTSEIHEQFRQLKSVYKSVVSSAPSEKAKTHSLAALELLLIKDKNSFIKVLTFIEKVKADCNLKSILVRPEIDEMGRTKPINDKFTKTIINLLTGIDLNDLENKEVALLKKAKAILCFQPKPIHEYLGLSHYNTVAVGNNKSSDDESFFRVNSNGQTVIATFGSFTEPDLF